MQAAWFVRWTPVFLWMIAIFWVSHQPKSTLEAAQPSSLFHANNFIWGSSLELSPDTIAGKSAHVVVFGALAFLIWQAGSSVWLTLAGTALYGLLDELHQSVIPGRTPRLADVLFDVLGALLVIGWICWSRRSREVSLVLRSD